MPESPKLSLVNVFITAVCMVAVSWAFNRLAYTFDKTTESEAKITERKAARDREIDLMQGRLHDIEQTQLEILKLMSERNRP